jgi:uncharacterized protein (DUF1501 family)
MTRHTPDLQRRGLLIGTAAAASMWSTLSVAGKATPESTRLVVVILRGGMDGLSAVPAIGDPDFASARGALGQFASAPLALDNTFALHPELKQLHAMFKGSEVAVVHAVGLPYRERSHFDAQQVLESGGTKPYELSTGWLGRALVRMDAKGMALNTAVPLVLRGHATVDTWAPSVLPDPSAELVARLERMYGSDAALATALSRAKELHLGPSTMAADMDATGGNNGKRGPGLLSQRAAEFLSQPNGPRVAVMEMGGWDTHANQSSPHGSLVGNLRTLDAGLAALRDGLVASGTWKRTVVVVMTEFGREVAMNGTQGTDHGTGGAAFVVGGAVKGGRVIGTWPGLAKKDRFEGRDLRTTTDMRSLLKGVLADHMQVAMKHLDSEVFPGSQGLPALQLV